MNLNKIKSHAKINLTLSVVGKSKKLHKIESVVAFIDLYDLISIKKIRSKNHLIVFKGKFKKKINSNNTVSKLLNILEKKKMINQKFYIKIIKNIPQESGLGGGSMNAANILRSFIKKKIIKIDKKKAYEISNDIGSDVILGLEPTNSIITSKNKIIRFRKCKRFFTLIVKPNFGCSTKEIYAKVDKFDKVKKHRYSKKMFNLEYLKKEHNSLEQVALNRYPFLKKIKSYLGKLESPIFVRMTGSGSALVSYYYSKKQCDKAKKLFSKKYKKYWCVSSKTI